MINTQHHKNLLSLAPSCKSMINRSLEYYRTDLEVPSIKGSNWRPERGCDIWYMYACDTIGQLRRYVEWRICCKIWAQNFSQKRSRAFIHSFMHWCHSSFRWNACARVLPLNPTRMPFLHKSLFHSSIAQLHRHSPFLIPHTAHSSTKLFNWALSSIFPTLA